MGRIANLTVLILTVCGVLALSGLAWSADGSDLISHWKFDEGEGDIAYDSAGDNDGIIYGAQWTDGIIDGALVFDGVGDYVDVGNDSSLKPGLPLTFSAWINFSESGKTIVSLEDLSSTYYGVWLNITPADRLEVSFGDGTGWADGRYRSTKIGTTGLSTDTWYHVAGVVRGATDMDVYVNGVDDGGTYSGTGGSLAYSSGNASIGTCHIYNIFFEGKIDDVRLYGRALSAEEILELYLPPLAVAVDIKPGSCPNPLDVKSRGVLPVAILGTEDFDVISIDVVSIRLAGVGAVRSAYEDVAGPVSDGNECECSEEGPDGYIDVTVKFRTGEVVEELKTHGDLIDGEVLALPLTGVLSDGSPIEGADCVRIIGKVPRALGAKRSDINEDGVVNILDFAMMAEYWLESAETSY